MVYIIHKILVLFKNHLNYLKDSIFKCLFKGYNRLFFSKKVNKCFSQHIMMKYSRLEKIKMNMNKNARNLFRPYKKELTSQLEMQEKNF